MIKSVLPLWSFDGINLLFLFEMSYVDVWDIQSKMNSSSWFRRCLFSIIFPLISLKKKWKEQQPSTKIQTKYFSFRWNINAHLRFQMKFLHTKWKKTKCVCTLDKWIHTYIVYVYCWMLNYWTFMDIQLKMREN